MTTSTASSNDTNGTTTVVDGTTYMYQNSGASDAATTLSNGSLQFTVQGGDYWSSDPTDVNRSEIASTQLIANGTPIDVSYNFSVLSGAVDPNTNDWAIIGQFHQDSATGSPPFAVELVDGKMEIAISYTGSNGAATTKVIWSDPNTIVQGANYSMNIQVTFDANGNGHLTVSRDGVVIVNYTGPLGYDNQTSVYWKEGIYRTASSGTMTVDYSNLAVTTGTAQTASASTAASVASSSASNVFSTTTDYDPTTGAMTSQTVIYDDGSQVVDTYSNGVHTSHVETNASGVETLIEQYNSNGSLSFMQQTAANGTLTTNTYSSSGQLQLTKVVNTDGSKVYTQYGVSGYQYITTYMNAQGVTTEQDQIHTDGSKTVYDYAITGQAYTSSVTTYNAAGVETSLTLNNTDGSKTIYAYAITGQAYTSSVTLQNAQGATTEFQAIYANGSKVVTDYGVSGQNFKSETTTYNAAGVKTAFVVNYTNGSSENDTYTNGVMTQQVLTAANGTQTTNTYSSSGQLQLTKVVNTDGSKVYTQYGVSGYQYITTYVNAQGVTTEQDQIHTDGSKTVNDYAITGQAYTSSVTNYNAAGVETSSTGYHSNGTLAYANSLGTNGSWTQDLYDSTGRMTSSTVTSADGSVTAKALVAGISMASSAPNESFISFNTDTFAFSGNFGHDTITGFNAGSGSLHDTIQLSSSVASDFSHLAMAQVGANTVITLSAQNTITLQGVQASSLTASDFKFV